MTTKDDLIQEIIKELNQRDFESTGTSSILVGNTNDPKRPYLEFKVDIDPIPRRSLFQIKVSLLASTNQIAWSWMLYSQQDLSLLSKAIASALIKVMLTGGLAFPYNH